MQKVKKYLQYNLYELCLLLLIINSASYFFDKNYLLNSLSVLCGFLIYFTVDVYYFVSTSFFKSNNPSLILFKGICSTFIKYLILIFLLVIAFKYLSLNNLIILICFILLTLFKNLVTFAICKDN